MSQPTKANATILFCFAVFNLTNGIDVEETKRKVNYYKKENQTLILKNRERQVRRDSHIHDKICSCDISFGSVYCALLHIVS